MNKIISVRNKELHHLTNSMYLGAAVSFTFICAPFLVRKLKLHYFRIYPLGCRLPWPREAFHERFDLSGSDSVGKNLMVFRAGLQNALSPSILETVTPFGYQTISQPYRF